MIPGGIIGHEGGPCIILLLVPLGPVNILYLVWGTNSDMIFGPMGPLLGGTSFTVTGLPHPWVVIEDSHENVSGILEHFLGYMEVGDYFVVEDTHPYIPAQLGYGRISKEEYTPCGSKLLKIVKEFLTKHEKECAVDSYFTDFFGYNGTIDSIARTWIGNAHSITIARKLQSSLRSAHT